VGAGKYQRHLVQVGHQHLAVGAARRGRQAGQLAAARVNGLDHAGAIGLQAHIHFLTHGCQVAPGGAALQPPAQLADRHPPIGQGHLVKTALVTDDSARQFVGVHGWGVWVGSGVSVGSGVLV